MDNLMTLDTTGESLPLQIKLSSHSDGVPYKMGGATEMNLVWVSGSPWGEVQEQKAHPAVPLPPVVWCHFWFDNILPPSFRWPPPGPVRVDKVAQPQWGAGRWARQQVPLGSEPSRWSGACSSGLLPQVALGRPFLLEGKCCQSWKCQVAPEPHQGLKELLAGKGRASWALPFWVFLQPALCVQMGQCALGCRLLRTSVNPVNHQPVPLRKNYLRAGLGRRSQGLQKVSSSFYIKILARKHTLYFCPLYQQQILELNSEASSWLHQTSAFPAANNFASAVDGDSNNSRWWMGGGEYGSVEIRAPKQYKHRGKNGKLVKREVLY